MTAQPNILIILTDQQSASAMSCAANPDLHTPNMDRLADAGVRFTNACCTHPLCTPSRMSLLTGRMPSAMGIKGNAGLIPQELRSQELGTLLRAAGYDCVYGGKWHAGGPIHLPDITKDDHGFVPICGFDDNALPGACVRFFQQPHDRPFLMVASFDNPHNICEAGRDSELPWGDVPPAAPQRYPNLPPNFQPSTYEPQALVLRRSLVLSHLMAMDYTEDRWRQYRHDFFRLVEMVDAHIGTILDGLDASALANNTIVIFTSDHGEMAGAHQLGHKQVLYEESVGVPLIIRDGRRPQPRVDTHLVSNGLDLLPTCCDYAGIAPPERLWGTSLRPLVEGRDVDDWRDQVVAETWFNAPPHQAEARMVRTQRYKYIAHRAGKNREQLFDLQRDPGEMVNLAVEARFKDVLNEHRARLAQWCVSAGDLFGRHYAHPHCATIPGLGFIRLGPAAPKETKDHQTEQV